MREERAENLRLLYVALTRAKYRCWMVWGNIKERRLPRRRGCCTGAESDARATAFGTDTIAAHERKPHGRSRAHFAASGRHDRACRSRRPANGVRFARHWKRTVVPAARAFARVAARYALGDELHGARARPLDRSARLRCRRQRRARSTFPTRAARCRPRHLRVPARRAGGEVPARDLRAGRFRSNSSARELERVVAKELAAHGFDAVWLRTIADMVRGGRRTRRSTRAA